ncbi:hypothetical protein ACFFMN_28070 [Planobispora siamensis]|uniref:Uncharacterized protein n=1 Tax=Planobispora siamensis TaxID=936338 RepID=A0A8J3SP25_9ACTN|nr:hypothetical protein [Planobispora siamensis]GIH97961.1 hypothetical protein Psi01_85910 [Planobispora siamensis]
MNTPACLLTLTAAAAAFTVGAGPALAAAAMPVPAPSPTLSPAASAAAIQQAVITYTCTAPAGTGAAIPAQVTASLPATAALGQPVTVQWNLATGLLAPDALAAGTALQKGTLKLTGSAPVSLETSSAANSAVIGKGQALQLPAMQASYTPTQAGTLAITPGDVTIVLTRNGITEQSRCSADPAAAPLASLTVSAGGAAGGVPAAAPAPTVTVTVTATSQPKKKKSTPAPQTAVTPKGGAPTGGGALAAASMWPYAGLGVGVLFAAGLGWEIRRKRIHGY